MTIKAVGLVLILASGPLLAADQNGSFAVEGHGLMSCTQFATANVSSPEYRGAVGWIEGYVTAFNQLKRETYDLTPWQTTELLAGAIRNVCSHYGDLRLVEATNAMISQLVPERLEQETPVRRLDNGQHTVFIYDDVLADLQDRLHRLDYLPDADAPLEEGQFFAAMRQFQVDRGLSDTGLPDMRTMLALMAE